MIELFKNKSKRIFYTLCFIFVPIWSIFLINNILLNGSLNFLGSIHPRNFSILNFFTICTSWMFHAGTINNNLFNHILGNSQILLGLLIIIALIEELPILLLISLIIISGFSTWLLGSPDSAIIGASGLAFSLFGYILSSIFFRKKLIYLIPTLFFGSTYGYIIINGLIPTKGISFAAHFGGFLSGILLSYLIGKFTKLK